MNILSGMFKRSYENKGLKASGKWGKSLATFSDKRGVGVEADYNSSIMMTKGRYPYGSQDPKVTGSYSNIGAIKEWIKVKQGLPQAFKDNPDKFAFIIARKHFLEGVKVPNEHNKGNVLSEPIDDFVRNYLPKMWDELGSSYVFELQKTITKNFK